VPRVTAARSVKRVLVIGKDGRTDALAAGCVRSATSPELYTFAEMPIPGLVEKSRQLYEGSLRDCERLVEVVRDCEPDLVIIGPEEPLEAGFVDVLDKLGIAAFGPSKRLAAIETSKSWARALLERNDIPGNPEHRLFEDEQDLYRFMDHLGSFVVKPDGLTAGKGVKVYGDHFSTLAEGFEYARAVLRQSGRVQIEQKLEGQEFSLQTITDGTDVVHCPLVQDHKRAYAGDRGPNTGGMGSYSCADFALPFLDQADVAAAQAINEQVIEALARETGELYKGVLYGGFIATRDGVALIEYNARFGDPEVMNVLPLLDGDFVEMCSAVTTGTLGQVSYAFQPKATVCKYVVPIDYPGKTTGEEEIVVPAESQDSDTVKWYWAASTLRDGRTYMSSSRAGAVVGLGDTLADAEREAEQAAAGIVGPVRYRSDIGREDVVRERCDHIQQLRSRRPSPISY
jgi:phosphoribosylamine--glycine ligase